MRNLKEIDLKVTVAGYGLVTSQRC